MNAIYREPATISTDIVVSISDEIDSDYLEFIPPKENVLTSDQLEYTYEEVVENIEKINKEIFKSWKKGKYAHYYLPNNKQKLAQKLITLYKKQGYNIIVSMNISNTFLDDLFGKKSVLLIFSMKDD